MCIHRQNPATVIVLMLMLLSLASYPLSAGERPSRSGERKQSLAGQLAGLRADLGICNENIKRLAARLQTLQTRQGQLQKKLKETRGRLRKLRETVKQLRAAVRSEKEARRKAVQRLLRRLSGQLDQAVGRLQVGEQSAAASTQKDVQGEYTVVKGDTLSAIAKAFDVSVQQLKQANDLENALIKPGQRLLIPAEQE